MLRHFLPSYVIRKLRAGVALPFTEHVPCATVVFADIVGTAGRPAPPDPSVRDSGSSDNLPPASGGAASACISVRDSNPCIIWACAVIQET